MDRRSFLKSIGLTSLVATLPTSFKLYSAPNDYTGKLLITVQAEGGWDVTSFCDPKMNSAGEREINTWARTGEIQTAGNLQYAPVASNAAFFQKYYRDMLVINGIDSQTNSHSAGVTHNWSGRISEGFPSLTALFASINAPNLPISYVNNGGYTNTGNLIRYTRLENTNRLINVIYPNNMVWDQNQRWIHDSDWERIQAARANRMQSLTQDSAATTRQIRNRANYLSSLENAGSLTDFATALTNAGNIQEPVQSGNLWSSFRRQAQLALIAMSSGVTVSADLMHGGFDTHQNHDTDQNFLLSELTGGLDYLWTYAEQLGIADRLVVVIGSDFGRTPHYNSDAGKDHWPITSTIIMEKNVSWGNRMVGITDGIHNTQAVNTQTLQADPQGSYIYPKHVMQALRDYLGLSEHPNASSFALNATEGFNFFGS